jgi:hypothetical protein
VHFLDEIHGVLGFCVFLHKGVLSMQHHSQQNSRLGRVLVNKGQLSEAQLEFALVEQAESGLRLGEVLVAHGWISDAQLHRALKRQSLIRRAGTIATVICAPLHATSGFAATVISKPVMPLKRTSVTEQVADLPSGLVALTDEEMSGAAAQGPFDVGSLHMMNIGYDGAGAGLRHKYNDEDEESQQSEEQVAYELMDSVTTVMGFGPLSSAIEADISVEGFRRFEGVPTISLLEDGGVRFYTGFQADRINIENIRVKGSEGPETFGSIYMTDVEFAPGSNYTIRSGDSRW